MKNNPRDTITTLPNIPMPSTKQPTKQTDFITCWADYKLYWRIDDNECLVAQHPYYHDQGSPLYYKIYYKSNIDFSGAWIIEFEGSKLYTREHLIDALLECELDCEKDL